MTGEMKGVHAVNVPQSVKQVGALANAFYDDLRLAPSQGRKVAWAGGYPSTFPLLRAMDVAYLFEDVYAATAAARHVENPLQLASANLGYLPEMCSYSRTTIGMAHMPVPKRKEIHPYYDVPNPDMMTYIDPGCSMICNWSDAGRRMFDVPMFGIALPYLRTWEDEDDVVHETLKQFQEMIVFLEDICQKPFNWDALRKNMVWAKEASALRLEAQEIAGLAPKSPATFFDWAATVGALSYGLGTEESVGVIRAIRDEMRQRVNDGVTALPDEQVRAFWMGHMCWPYMGWWGNLLADLGVNVIAATYTHQAFMDRPELIDPEDPLPGLAKNSIMCVGTSIEILAQRTIDQMRKYNIDAIICHNTQTCRVFAAPQREIVEIIQRELGCPVTYIDGDVADPSFFSTEQARTRVEVLKEIVLSQRKRRG
jgi:benzoyl-CoA reductase subunit B